MPREYVLQPFRAPVELHIDYARELNEQQHAAVTAVPGPALVIAGAGSGKTRTLTYRVAYLLEQGVPAERILLLTFTNKAAREMMRRVADLLGGDIQVLWGGTFHSIGARLLRRHAEAIGYRPDYTILDREDATELMKICLGEAPIDQKATRFPGADVLADILSKSVNMVRPVADVIAEDYPDFVRLEPQIAAVLGQYAVRKTAANVMDFDDLLVLWFRLLQDNAELRERYQRQFQFILVDEYQDTNQLQGELIDLLAARHQNVMVVGDDAQSIYAWRGANFRNILEFPKRYPAAKVYKIETNYRSTPEILSLANAAIAANIHQFAKALAPARSSGPKPILLACGDASEQAAFVAQRALELREEGVALGSMAVLYRSHFHALELQLELTRRNIPFSITSGLRFFEQAHIKDVAAWLKLVTNPADEVAFKRLVTLLPGIGGKSASKLWQKFQAEIHHPGDPAAAPAADPGSRSHGSTAPIATALQRSAVLAPKKSATAWARFTIAMSQLETPPVRGEASEMIRHIIEAGYAEYLQETYPNHQTRLEDVEQLANFALQFKSVEEFLTQMSLLTSMDTDVSAAPVEDEERLRLSTIHQAKGLEFDVVFVIMLCDGLFPNSRACNTAEGEEEERRLFYVAITRARNELHLTYPLMRMMRGADGDMMQTPSRFLGELPRELLDEWNLRAGSQLY